MRFVVSRLAWATPSPKAIVPESSRAQRTPATAVGPALKVRFVALTVSDCAVNRFANGE
jgi:hypothetical protein